ncbi:hypothetical protein, conserved [Angomonas deanei]|uniref:Surface antigen-like protein n=1 Tax=Angomonas deanei TaxID=59799 RepID=A0A7G2CVK5_9TRYP|nr:hypothetical protein, conserved [Angomonas deanei]
MFSASHLRTAATVGVTASLIVASAATCPSTCTSAFQYADGSTQCAACRSGYGLHNGACVKLPAHCVSFTSTKDTTCGNCENGYVLTNGVCQKCTAATCSSGTETPVSCDFPNCQSCGVILSQPYCVFCVAGYYMSSQGCVPGGIANCALPVEENGVLKCSLCLVGQPSADKSRCETCSVKNCKMCYEGDCVVCNDGKLAGTGSGACDRTALWCGANGSRGVALLSSSPLSVFAVASAALLAVLL